MSDESESVTNQLNLLAAYRHTVAIFLVQQAKMGGEALAPPSVITGIEEARAKIADIKAVLHEQGFEVDDKPDDMASSERIPAARPKLKWIRVAGMGRPEGMPSEVVLASKQVGKALAHAGYGLITGGWRGVDYIVAGEFAKELRGTGKPLSEYLIQFVSKGSEPDYKGGQIVHIEAGRKNWIESVKHSDAVVLLGGEGGTYETYEHALQEQKAIFPLAGTKGDAEKAYNHMLEYWETQAIAGIEEDMFQRLGHKIETTSDASIVAKILVELLNQHLRYKRNE